MNWLFYITLWIGIGFNAAMSTRITLLTKDNSRYPIGFAFILLSLYILIQAIVELVHRDHPHTSVLGILWLFITALVMFGLAYGKKKAGTALQNPVLLTEAKVTVIDGLLAVSVLIGLLLNAYLGWWWTDIVASLVIVFYAIREAVHI